MNYTVEVLFSFTILIAGIIAVIRFKKISYAYSPFLICIGAGSVNEVLNVLLAINHHHNILNSNVYALAESLLITFLFKNLGIYKNAKKVFISVIISLILFWIAENLVYGNMETWDVYFRIFSSFIIVLMSVTAINNIIGTNRKLNATFLLCIGFIIYFTFKTLVYSFWISGFSNGFLSKIFYIMVYVNFLTNIIYAIAVLWMPRKQEFSLPY